MWHVSGNEDPIPGQNRGVMFQPLAVVDGAFAIEQVRDRLDAAMIVNPGPCAHGHGRHIHADVLRACCLSRRAGAIREALLGSTPA
jgi:hypothetical protein